MKEKILIFILIGVGLVVLIFLVSLFGGAGKNLELIDPIGGEEIYIGETYEILWRQRNIGKIGIVLFKGEQPKWIARDIDAGEEKYEWTIQPGQEFGDNYWLAVFEYPYREGEVISYSTGPFSVVFADIASCDSLSILEERPYIPINYPETRRVFITEGRYDGNMGGFEGANEICSQEAENLELEGSWSAFIGGDRETAAGKISRTSGVFISALPEGEVLRGNTCHRLLANDFDSFLSLFSEREESLKEKIGTDFLNSFSNLWTGRIRAEDIINCAEIVSPRSRDIEENYTFTISCQNWTINRRSLSSIQTMPTIIEDMPSSEDFFIEEEEIITSLSDFPICYTPEGVSVSARGLGGFSSIITEGVLRTQAKGCGQSQHILCIED